MYARHQSDIAAAYKMGNRSVSLILRTALLLLSWISFAKAVAVPLTNSTLSASNIIAALEGGTDDPEDIKCLGPPEGTSVINVNGNKEHFGVNVREYPSATTPLLADSSVQLIGWWQADKICVEAFDYQDTTQKLFIFWSKNFRFPYEYIREVRKPDYDLDVGFHTMPEQKKEFFVTTFGTAHGKDFEGDVFVTDERFTAVGKPSPQLS